MRDVAGEDHKPEPKGNPGKLTPVSDKDMDIIRGDSAESGSNSFAKNVQAAVKGLKKDFDNYSKAKKRDSAKVKG
jgi:hypothetical protein